MKKPAKPSSAQPPPTKLGLWENEEWVRVFADVSPDIITVFDRNGVIVFNSAAADKTHGYGAGDLQNHSTFDFIHPDDRARVESIFGQLLKGSPEALTVQYRYRNADGSYKWMEATGRNELANPHIRGIIAISRDITARKEMEAVLRESEAKHKLLFANAADAMYLMAKDNRILAANPAACQMLGYTEAELLNMTIAQIDTPDQAKRIPERVAKLNAVGHITFDAVHQHKNGSRIPVEVSARLVLWEGSPVVLSICRDIFKVVL